MNREQKAAVIDQVAGELQQADAVFAVDYRGISVQQAADLRTRLYEAGAHFRVVKNRLTKLAVDKAGSEGLVDVLEGPTALTFVTGDAALAAKAIATFRREHDVLAFKGGTMGGEPLTIEELEAIARLPAVEVLHGQLVGVVAAPLNGLVRGLGSLISGLAIQLGAIRDQDLVSGEAPPSAEEAPAAEGAPPAEEAPPAEASGEETPSDEAPGDPAAEGETAEQETDTPSEGDDSEEKEG